MVSVLIYFLSPELIPLDSLLLPFFSPGSSKNIHDYTWTCQMAFIWGSVSNQFVILHYFTWLLHFHKPSVTSLMSRPHPQEERVLWYLAHPSGFLNVDYFLGRIYPGQSHCRMYNTRNPWLLSAPTPTCAFFGVSISYQLGIMHVASCKLLMKPKDHQTLSLFSWVGSGHETKCHQIPIPPFLYM